MTNKRKYIDSQATNNEMLHSNSINYSIFENNNNNDNSSNNDINVINRVFSNKIILSHIFNMMQDLFPKKLATVDIVIDTFTCKHYIQNVCGIDPYRFTQSWSQSYKIIPTSSYHRSIKYKDISYFYWMVYNGHYNLLFDKLAHKEVVIFLKKDGLDLLNSYKGDDLDLLLKLYRIYASAEYFEIQKNVLQTGLCEPILPDLAKSQASKYINNEKLLDFFYIEQRFKLHPKDILYCSQTKNYQLMESIWKYQQLTNQEQLHILVDTISSGLEPLMMLFRTIPSIFKLFSTNPYMINMNNTVNINDGNDNILSYQYVTNLNKFRNGTLFYQILNFNDIDLVKSIKETSGLYIHANSLQNYINTGAFRNDILELCFTSYRDQITSIDPTTYLNINDSITNYGFQIPLKFNPSPSSSSTDNLTLPNIQPVFSRFKTTTEMTNSSPTIVQTNPTSTSSFSPANSPSFAPPSLSFKPVTQTQLSQPISSNQPSFPSSSSFSMGNSTPKTMTNSSSPALNRLYSTLVNTPCIRRFDNAPHTANLPAIVKANPSTLPPVSSAHPSSTFSFSSANQLHSLPPTMVQGLSSYTPLRYEPEKLKEDKIYRFNLKFNESMNDNEKFHFMRIKFELVMSNELPFIPHSDIQLPIIQYLYSTQAQIIQPHITLILSAYNGLLDIFTFIINHHRFLEYISQENLSYDTIFEELLLFSISNRSYNIIHYLVNNRPFADKVSYDEILLHSMNFRSHFNTELVRLLHPILNAKHISHLFTYAIDLGKSDLLRHIIMNYPDVHVEQINDYTSFNSSTITQYLDNFQYLVNPQSTYRLLNIIIRKLIRDNQTGLMAIFMQEKYRIYLNTFCIRQDDIDYLKEKKLMKMLYLLSTHFTYLEKI